MSSSLQTLPTVTVWDYEYVPGGGKPLAGETVKISLQATTASVSAPPVMLSPLPVEVTTDGNGYWSVVLVPNVSMADPNSVYTVRTRAREYQIQITGTVGPYQSRNLIVNGPTSLSPPVTTISNPITVTGLITAAGGILLSSPVTLPAGSVIDASLASTFVHLGGTVNETVTGVKTFSSAPVVPAASFPESAVTNLTTDLGLKAPLASPTFTGVATSLAYAVTGLTGATAASRYGGGTGGGPPTTGTWALGDTIVDQLGRLWVCTAGGTPGTWRMVAPSQLVARAHATGATSLANGADTKVLLAGIDIDPNSNFASSRYTATVAGYYVVGARVSFGTTATLHAAAQAKIFKNGTELVRAVSVLDSAVVVNVTAAPTVIQLAVSDYIEVYGWQNSGGAINTSSAWPGDGCDVSIAFHSSV